MKPLKTTDAHIVHAAQSQRGLFEDRQRPASETCRPRTWRVSQCASTAVQFHLTALSQQCSNEAAPIRDASRNWDDVVGSVILAGGQVSRQSCRTVIVFRLQARAIRQGSGNQSALSLRGVLLGAWATALWGRRDGDLTSVEQQQDAVGEDFFMGGRERHLRSPGLFRYRNSHNRRRSRCRTNNEERARCRVSTVCSFQRLAKEQHDITIEARARLEWTPHFACVA